MSRVRGWLETLRAVFRRGAMEREMADEFRFHMEKEVEANIASGMSVAEARAAAQRTFGGEDRHAEATRDARGVRWLDDLRADARLALRGVRREPGTAAVAILTLAVGIGATVAIFGVVNGVLLEPLPYRDADRLVAVWGRFLPESGFDFPTFPLSPPEYLDYRSQNTTMEEVAAIATFGATLVDGSGEARRVRGASVSAAFFDVLDVRPALGRTLLPSDDRPGGSSVVVLSHGLWQSAFGGDSSVVGRSARIDGAAAEIVGVMAPGFSFPGSERDVWRPLGLDPASPGNRMSHYLTAIGRLRPDVPHERAQSEMATLMARWRDDFPEIHTGHFLYLNSLTEDTVGNVRHALLLVLGAVGVVLLLVCVNVAHVLLAKGLARDVEMAVRTALGAPVRRLVQQTLVESGILALIGAGLGVLMAYALVGPIATLAEGSLPRIANIAIDGRVALFAVVLAVIVTLLSGLLPALRVRRSAPQVALREGGRGASGGPAVTRYRSVLVVAEVALASLVVLAAGLLSRSYRDLTRVDPGFSAEQVLIADLAVPAGDYPDAADIVAFYDRLQERLAGIPGVRAVSAISSLPLLETPGNTDFEVENRPAPAPGEPATSGDLVSMLPGMDRALGFRVLEGRLFDAEDGPDAQPVAVVNRTLARMFFDGDAIGARLRVAGIEEAPWHTIIGVVDEVLYASLDAAPRPAYYLPWVQTPRTFGQPARGLTFVIRTESEPMALAPTVRAAVREADRRLPIIRLDPMTRIVAESVARPRFTLSLFGAFASLAIVLGALGIYGVLSVSVVERRRELGIRMALGARRAGVVRVVLGRGLALTTLGLGIGFAASLATGRLLSTLLFGVAPTDPATYIATAALLLAIALFACAVPAARALRVDPARILRDG